MDGWAGKSCVGTRNASLYGIANPFRRSRGDSPTAHKDASAPGPRAPKRLRNKKKPVITSQFLSCNQKRGGEGTKLPLARSAPSPKMNRGNHPPPSHEQHALCLREEYFKHVRMGGREGARATEEGQKKGGGVSRGGGD